MPKSKHRKSHNLKLNAYKATKKIEQESLKKKMIENYTQMQQSNLMNQQGHNSIQDVSGPEINIDDLNMTEKSSLYSQCSDIENITDFNQPLDKPIEL